MDRGLLFIEDESFTTAKFSKCLLVADEYSTPIVVIMRAIAVLLASINFLFLGATLHYCIRMSARPLHLRSIVVSLIAAIFVLDVFIVVRAFIFFALAFMDFTSQCSFLQSSLFCYINTQSIIVPLSIVIFLLTTVTFEKVTEEISGDEDYRVSTLSSALFWALLPWIIIPLSAGVLFLTSDDNTCTVASFVSSNHVFSQLLSVMSVACVVSSLFLVAVHIRRKNLYLPSGSCTIGEKYNFDEKRTLARSLLSSSVVTFFAGVLEVVLSDVNHWLPIDSHANSIIREFSNILLSAYSIAAILSWTWQNKVFRRKYLAWMCLRNLGKRSIPHASFFRMHWHKRPAEPAHSYCEVAHITLEGKEYFDMYRKLWHCQRRITPEARSWDP